MTTKAPKPVKAWALFRDDGQSWWTRGKDGVCKHVTYRTRNDALEEAKHWIPVSATVEKILVIRVLVTPLEKP